MFISCNNIIISTSSQKCQFHNQEVIKYKPSLFIDDPQGILPLKLDRSDFDTDVLPFEDDLILDVSKDFIAQLLMLPSQFDKIKSDSFKNGTVRFLYWKNGFTLLSDYFIPKISENTVLFRIIINNNSLVYYNDIFSSADNIAVYYQSHTNIKSTNQNYNIVDEAGGCFLLPKEKYDNLFNDNKKRIPRYIKNNHKLVLRNGEYVIYNYNEYTKRTNVLEKIIDGSIKINFEGGIQSVQELPLMFLTSKKVNEWQYLCSKGGNILNKLFQTYFGDNIIIPYDMSERKKLYKKAFEDLGDYMKSYEKKEPHNSVDESES
jgi:hypothetical protein